MTNRLKRWIALLLAAALCFSTVPFACAAEADGTESAVSSAAEEAAETESAASDAAESAVSEAAEEAAETESTVPGAAEETAEDEAAENPAEANTDSLLSDSSGGELAAEAAESADTAESTTQRTITGFGSFDVDEHSLTISEENPPAESALTAQMPETLEVQLDGSDDYTEIPVEWSCLGDEYGDENIYLFQYSPEWADGYVLSEEIDLYTQAPCILVYVSCETEESISACSTVSSEYAEEEVEIYEYLRGTLGYNAAAACGVLANMYAESSLKPNNMQNSYEKKLGYTDETYTEAVDSGEYAKFGTDSVGYGLCQWTVKVLKKPMLSLSQSKEKSIGSLSLQLAYLKKTLSANDSDCLYNGATINSHMKSDISNSASGAYDAAYYWCEKYEIPGDLENQCIKRGNSAKSKFWPIYKNYSKYNLDVTLSESTVSYTGNKQKPSVTVEYNSTVLTSGTDYTVSYKNNVNAGVATVTVTGAGDYDGYQGTATFVIETTAPVLKSASHLKSGITVQWEASPGATRYRLFRKTSSGWTKVGDTTDTCLTDDSASEAGSYTYTVRCIDKSSNTYASDYDETGLTIQRLGTPEIKKVSNCAGSVKVTWGAVSGAERYRVYRKTGSGSWETLGETTSLSYRDKTAKNGKSYTYTVRCVDEETGACQSGHTNGLTTRYLSVPTLKSAKNVSGKKITVSWTKNSSAGGYQIRYQTGSKTKTVKVSSAKTLKKTIKKLKKGKTYAISVRAYKKVSGTTYYSAWSGSVSVKVKK